jgi:ABC-type sugar transport system ATPase subunit
MTTSTPILSVVNVSKKFGGVLALDDVSLALQPGEVLALAGDNGAGKSTLIKIISGVYQPDGGAISFRGSPADLPNPAAARNFGIETIYQDLALSDNLDVGANVFLGREPMNTMLGFLPRINRPFMREAARKLLDDLDIDISESKMSMPVGALSGGQRQAVAIARAMYWDASVLIMDEPTAALGVPEQLKVMALIRRLKKENVAVIFISHNLTDIFNVADRIMVLRRGKVAGERLTKETTDVEIVSLMVGNSFANQN